MELSLVSTACRSETFMQDLEAAGSSNAADEIVPGWKRLLVYRNSRFSSVAS